MVKQRLSRQLVYLYIYIYIVDRKRKRFSVQRMNFVLFQLLKSEKKLLQMVRVSRNSTMNCYKPAFKRLWVTKKNHKLYYINYNNYFSVKIDACWISCSGWLAAIRTTSFLPLVFLCIAHLNYVLAVLAWTAFNIGEPCPVAPRSHQAWDDIGTKRFLKRMINLAGLRAKHSRHLSWVLDDDSWRWRCMMCEPHRRSCGTIVKADGHTAQHCRRCTGRFSRYHALKDIVLRTLISANISCMLKPP